MQFILPQCVHLIRNLSQQTWISIIRMTTFLRRLRNPVAIRKKRSHAINDSALSNFTELISRERHRTRNVHTTQNGWRDTYWRKGCQALQKKSGYSITIQACTTALQRLQWILSRVNTPNTVRFDSFVPWSPNRRDQTRKPFRRWKLSNFKQVPFTSTKDSEPSSTSLSSSCIRW